MSEHEPPELPEAKDPFERQVALTVAILAVVLSLVSSAMDTARLKALLFQSQAVDQWSYYQSKSTKGTTYELAQKAVSVFTDSAIAADKREAMQAEFTKSIEKYTREKEEIQKKAEGLQEDVNFYNERIEHLEWGETLLHIAIVLGSITILIRLPWLWWMCLGLGTTGAVLGFIPLLTREPLLETKPGAAMVRPYQPSVSSSSSGELRNVHSLRNRLS